MDQRLFKAIWHLISGCDPSLIHTVLVFYLWHLVSWCLSVFTHALFVLCPEQDVIKKTFHHLLVLTVNAVCDACRWRQRPVSGSSSKKSFLFFYLWQLVPLHVDSCSF